MAILSNFEAIFPRNRLLQSDIVAWTLKRHLASEPSAGGLDHEAYAKLFGRYAIKETVIAARSFESEDISGQAQAEDMVYPVIEGQPSGAGIGQRTRFFARRANAVFEKFYEGPANNPFHLVHVTCTGYQSPSAAQLLVAKKGWGEQVAVTHAYHMGCYASLPAIRVAQGLVATHSQSAGQRVDIVHTEMCGLHMNAAARTPEQIVVQSLFADGHIKYSVSAAASSGLKILAIREQILPDSHQDMSWAPESWGMQMNLSRAVPDKIRQEISGFFSKLSHDAGINASELLKNGIFAVHPGGPRIIDAVADMLKLSEAQISQSRKVLRERGNMSSATLPHVWKEILASAPAPGTLVASFAFGPGLTIFGAVFEVQ